MDCIKQHEIIDRILLAFRDELGKDFEQYRHHVYRVYNLAAPLVATLQDVETISVAAAFHDLGIWTNNTFDYLEPSIKLARQYSADNNLEAGTIREIETIINKHHKLTRVKTSSLAEIFRQADLVDLSLGLIRCGRKRQHIRLVRKTFPNRGFHLHLCRLFFKNLLSNPFRPLPMYKW